MAYMNFSVKAKFLSIIITLSVLGLSVFGYYTFRTYKQDKLAFVFESLTSETQAKSKLFSAVAEDYELLLVTIISSFGNNNKESLESLKNFLSGDQRRISGLHFHIPSNPEFIEQTLFQSKEDVNYLSSWDVLKRAPTGVSILDKKEGLFLMKKQIGDDGFAALVFHHAGLWELLDSKGSQISFLFSNSKIITKKELSVSSSELLAFAPKLEDTPGGSGLMEVELAGAPYFLTYSKLEARGLTLVNLIPTKNVLLIENVIVKQVGSFLVLMIGVSLLIGTIAAKWLTVQLDTLTFAAEEMKKENFDVTINVTSKDELGKLGSAFNAMNTKIKSLLEELRIYNLELEEKVKERTRELQNLTDIQKGMVNALGQGFVIIDKSYQILPVYSKISEEMFEVVPNEVEPSEIMKLGDTDAQSLKELYEMAAQGMIGLDDVIRLAPETRSNSKNQRIQLTYAPINNSDSNEFEYMLVVGTDKTAEYENMEKFKKEWNYSQMISKVASNRFAINKIIGESIKMIADCFTYLETDKAFAVRDIQRLVHTIKGGFSYFYIAEVTSNCHELETYLQEFYNEEHIKPQLKEVIVDKLFLIQTVIENYIDQYDSIIQYKESQVKKSIRVSDLMNFSDVLKTKSTELKDVFQLKFFRSPIAPYFQMYPTMVEELSKRLNKNVKFKMVGSDIEIPDGPWEEIFQQTVHFIRNSMDHGLEVPSDRVQSGKPEQGTITFSFKTINDEALQVVLEDDGRGVVWQKLAAKDSSITCLEDALTRIRTGGISSKDEVSDLSGRGVGVSSLFAAVDKIGGQSKFESFENKGTRITFVIPYSKIKKNELKLAA